jgi:hypothetical protein
MRSSPLRYFLLALPFFLLLFLLVVFLIALIQIGILEYALRKRLGSADATFLVCCFFRSR